MRIVIVDSQIVFRLELCSLIKESPERHQIVGFAENGYDGMKVIEDLSPDLVLTDIKIPKVSGLNMIRNLREKGICPKYVVLSRSHDFEDAMESLNLGVSRFLPKPVDARLFLDTLSDLDRQCQSGRRQADRTSAGKRTSCYGSLVNSLLGVIEREYGKRLSLEELADRFHVTPEYLSALFKKRTGVCFSDYLKYYRIERAKELIANQRLKIYEVAYKVGYPDPRYFCRVFKNVVGVSAGEYMNHQSSSA